MYSFNKYYILYHQELKLNILMVMSYLFFIYIYDTLKINKLLHIYLK